MHSPRQSVVRTGIAAGILAVAVVLGGCAPGPAPTPTPTPLFTSEAEAFKAAEAVYREYVDALGASNDGNSDADPDSYLTGTALEHSIESARKRKAEGLRLVGGTTLEGFEGMSAALDPMATTVIAEVCIDASKSSVVDSTGKDVTPEGREPRARLTVKFSQSKTTLLINSSDFVSNQC